MQGGTWKRGNSRIPHAAGNDPLGRVLKICLPLSKEVGYNSDSKFNPSGDETMSPTLQELGIDRMSHQDRLRLIGEIWESITPLDQLEIPESHREELDRRLAAADADPAAGRPWEEVRARLRGEK
jgi:putative addiction module component (TIGR02574 family)